jgi:hypothetical protein
MTFSAAVALVAARPKSRRRISKNNVILSERSESKNPLKLGATMREQPSR